MRPEGPIRKIDCVHELFAEQAERTPERIALIGDGQQLSYRRAEPAGEPTGAIICRGWEWGRKWWLGCVWSGRWRWWWR